MLVNAKNMAKGLVVSKKSPIFALPKECVSTKSYIVDSTLWAYPCSTSASCSRASLARIKGVRPFSIHTTTFDEQCQRRSKVVCRRSIVTDPHPSTSIVFSRPARFYAHILPTLTSFGSKSTVSPRRRTIGSSRLSRPANRFSRSGQPSSSSSSAQSSCGSTTSLYHGANSRKTPPCYE